MLTLFFVDDLPATAGTNFEFDSEDAHHAIKVLRIGVGEVFNLSDGKGSWARVTVKEVHKKSMTLHVLENGFEEPLNTHFTVVQAIPKGDRIKDSIELSTEGGADRIVMWKASRSIGKADEKIEKLQQTAREASKQSRRFRIPEVSGVASTEAIVDVIAKVDLALVFHESAINPLTSIVRPGAKSVAIIIGPEGGLTDEELETFAQAGAKVVLLGRPILRSAHAGIAALAAVNTALSVW
jgi:16S rRNA (uracil1498-N3)-methyltransferase